jgi:hypothetical protein
VLTEDKELEATQEYYTKKADYEYIPTLDTKVLEDR